MSPAWTLHDFDEERIDIIPPILQVFYRLDSLSNLFGLAVVSLSVATPLALVFGAARPRGFWRAFVLVLLGAAGFLSLLYTNNLLAAYLSWEAVGMLCLLAWPRGNSPRRRTSLKVWLVYHIAGYPLLAGIILLQAQAGTLDYTSPTIAPAFGGGIFLLFFLTIGARLILPLSAFAPLRLTLPLAVLREVLAYSLPGVYLLTRTYSLGRWDVNWNLLVISFGAALLVAAVWLMLRAKEPGEILSRFALGQVAYIVVAVGVGSALAAAAGLLYLITFALAFTVLLIGLHRANPAEDSPEISGLPVPLSAPTSALGLGGLVLGGLPFLGSFVSQWLFYNAALESGYPILAVVGGPATLALALLLFKADRWTWGNEGKGRSWGWLVISPMVVVVLLAFGVVPQLPLTYLIKPAIAALAPGLTELRALEIRPWLGLEISRGNGLWGLWFPAPALILFILAMIAGYLIFRFGRPSGEPVDVFAGGDGPGEQVGRFES